MICTLPVVTLLSLGTAQDPAPTEAAPVPAPAEAAPAPTPEGPTPVATTAPVADPTPNTLSPAPKKRRFVFAFQFGVTAGLSRLPSVDLAFFFGGRLPRGPWALGYQFTFSSGFADRYGASWATHRHHITAMRSFGKHDRGFTSVGGGVAVLAVYPVIEAEARVAYRFGKRRRGIVGGLARLGWNVAYREQAPVPQLGVVFGMSLL